MIEIKKNDKVTVEGWEGDWTVYYIDREGFYHVMNDRLYMDVFAKNKLAICENNNDK